jgi:DNA-binding GntR family transcriptional regulator
MEGDLLNSKVQAHSLVDAVTERLEAAILNGSLGPGTKLSEQAIAKSLGVSRGPLREAIRRLEGRRLLKRTPNIGVHVVALSVQEVDETMQVQEALQGLACALAAKSITDAEISELTKILSRYKRKPNGSEDYDAWDLDFHSRIISASGNERLVQMLREDVFFLFRLYHSRSTTTREHAMRVLKEHEAIVAALARRDASGAERLMREHIQIGREISLAAFEGRPPRSPATKNRAAVGAAGSKPAD